MRTMRARVRRVCSENERGFSTLEAVVVIPAVVIMTMLVIQYVMLWHARNVAEAAAQNALRIARGYQSTAVAGQTSATQYLRDVAGNLLHCHNCVHVERTATAVTVTIHATVSSVVPFGSYTVTESASGPVEKYSPVG
jgi:Flp pilus assembly protein TadG